MFHPSYACTGGRGAGWGSSTSALDRSARRTAVASHQPVAQPLGAFRSAPVSTSAWGASCSPTAALPVRAAVWCRRRGCRTQAWSTDSGGGGGGGGSDYVWSTVVNFYEVLGIPPDATPDAIKARYRSLAKSTHPDVAGSDAAVVERFLAVKRAYDTLSQEMLRAEHDRALGIGAASTVDPRFARFNRWRAEVVPELEAQLRIWSDEIASVLVEEAAAWRAALSEARAAADAAAAALDAWEASGGAAAAAAAIAAVGSARFGLWSEDGEDRTGRPLAEGEHEALDAWHLSPRARRRGGGDDLDHHDHDLHDLVSDADHSSDNDGSGSGGGGEEGPEAAAARAARVEEQARLAEAARAALLELLNLVEGLKGAAGAAQPFVQRQYDKRLEQVSSRYRTYGEIVWYDVFEPVGAAWLADAEMQADAQRGQLNRLRAAADALVTQAQTSALV